MVGTAQDLYKIKPTMIPEWTGGTNELTVLGEDLQTTSSCARMLGAEELIKSYQTGWWQDEVACVAG